MSVGDRELRSLLIQGSDGGPMPLTWGQGNMWDSMTALGSESERLNVAWSIPLKGAVTVTEALDRIGHLLSCLDIFRVSFDVERVEQAFRSDAGIEVRVTEVAADAASARREVNTRKDPACVDLASKAFGMRESPIRLGLQHVRGIVTQIDVAMSHLGFDGSSCRPLDRLLRDAVEGRGISAVGMQTGELVEYEQSADQVRRSDAVINGWLAASSRLPPGRGLMAMTPGRYSVTILRSRAAAVAVQALAVRHGVSASGIVVSALTEVIRRHLYSELSALLVVCSNRSHPRLTDFVGQTIGNGLLVLPSQDPGGRFADYAKKTYARTLLTYSRARYDCLKWRDALTDLTARGLATDLTYYFNDVRSDRGTWSGLERRLPDLKVLLEETSIATVGRRDLGDATLFADLGSHDQELTLQVVCDDTRISSSDVVSALTAFENLLVIEALESGTHLT